MRAINLGVILAVASLFEVATSFAGGSDGAGGSRFYYDTLKIKALVSDQRIESKMMSIAGYTLDGITLKGIDNINRMIRYEVVSGHCVLIATLTWDEGWDPNYRVVSVDDPVCK